MGKALPVLLLCGIGVMASAQTDSPVARVAAGLVLAESAVASGDANLLLTGLEMMTAHAPKGEAARTYQDLFQSEARFLIRGDAALAKRLETTVQARPGVAQPGIVWIVAGGTTFEPPAAQGIAAFTAPGRETASQVLGEAASSCQRSGAIWACAPDALQGRVSLGPAQWVVIETRPVAP